MIQESNIELIKVIKYRRTIITLQCVIHNSNWLNEEGFDLRETRILCSVLNEC